MMGRRPHVFAMMDSSPLAETLHSVPMYPTGGVPAALGREGREVAPAL